MHKPLHAAAALLLACFSVLPLYAQEITRTSSEARNPAPHASAAKRAPAISPSTIGLIGLGLAGIGLAAGGGGGGEKDRADEPGDTTPPSPTGPLDLPAQIAREAEYRSNPALVSAGAAHKYADGFTGKGVLIGVLDSGIQDTPSLAGQIRRPAGYSAIGLDYQGMDGNLRHGTSVAQVIAGRRDGQGSHGVAYDAHIVDLAVMNDSRDAAHSPADSFSFAPAVQHGLDAGVRLFNASLAYSFMDPAATAEDFRTGLKSALLYQGIQSGVELGALFVVSTGNEADFRANLLASAAALPEFAGHVIAVTAIDGQDQIADFATRCGTLQAFCLSAVGVDIPTFRPDGTRQQFSGTSASAPVVTGSIALLRQEFPELSLPDTANILLSTARDLGAPGVDAVYGHGALDLRNAVLPQGEMRIAAGTSVQGPSFAAADSAVLTKGPLAGTLAQALGTQTITLYDTFTRGFEANLAHFVAEPLADSPVPGLDIAASNGTLTVRNFGPDGTTGHFEAHSRLYSLGYGRADLFAQAARNTAPLKGYHALSALEEANSAAVSTKGPGMDIGASAQNHDNFAIWTGLSGQQWRGAVGHMREHSQILGTTFKGAMGQNGGSDTTFADVSWKQDLSGPWGVAAQGHLAYTTFRQDGIFQSGHMLAGAAQLSVAYTTSYGGTWTGFVGTPLTVHKGTLTLNRPDKRLPGTETESSQGIARVQTAISLNGAQTPVDLGIRYGHTLHKASLSATAGIRFHDQDHTPFGGLAVSMRF